MRLTNQVTSLGLSQRLEKLGVKQESQFYWQVTAPLADPKLVSLEAMELGLKWNEQKGYKTRWYAAFTVAELFKLMPMTYESVEQHSNDYRAGWKKNGLGEEYGRGDTPAEALGLILEYLITNNLMKV